MSDQPTPSYVGHIPDLMTWDDYEPSHERKLVRFRKKKLTEKKFKLAEDTDSTKCLP